MVATPVAISEPAARVYRPIADVPTPRLMSPALKTPPV
jgi:hypothetical protein